jgi:two-component system, sensor histidine kinase and response regulator
VEDNPAMNMAICDILELNQYQVRSAFNGQDALLMLEEQRPDVVLCDIMMPGMDGYTLLQHARTNDRWRTIPFIFLTARSSQDDRRRAKGIGIEDYLVKPVEPEDLLISIENALRRVRVASEETQQQMDELRNQIVGALQHEFRTPLTFILGYAEYLAEVSDNEVDLDTLHSAIGAILEGGQRLQRLIENFLLLAELQNREILPEQSQPLNAYCLWADVAQEFLDLLAKNQLEVHLSRPEIPIEVYGFQEYIAEALKRLLDNAISYRRPSSHTIWLSVKQVQGYTGLCIQDEGVGIPSEILVQMRQPFEQVDRNNRTLPGAGLSLAMIHHVARLHGGNLSIESVLGQGSTFTLWLPSPPARSQP